MNFNEIKTLQDGDTQHKYKFVKPTTETALKLMQIVTKAETSKGNADAMVDILEFGKLIIPQMVFIHGEQEHRLSDMSEFDAIVNNPFCLKDVISEYMDAIRPLMNA